MAARRIPVSCSLTAPQVDVRLAEWADLRGEATLIESLSRGVRMHLPIQHAERAKALAAAERTCCSFLEIGTIDRAGSLEIMITAADPDGVAVVHLLAGLTQTAVPTPLPGSSDRC